MIDLLKLKLKGYLVIDNFFPDEICYQLRCIALDNKQIDFDWNGYVARDFDKGGDSLKDIADRYVSSKVSFIRKEFFIR